MSASTESELGSETSGAGQRRKMGGRIGLPRNRQRERDLQSPGLWLRRFMGFEGRQLLSPFPELQPRLESGRECIKLSMPRCADSCSFKLDFTEAGEPPSHHTPPTPRGKWDA